MSETIKHEFMVRLRTMINHVKQTNGDLSNYCPASTLPLGRFEDPNNEILSEKYCWTCRKVMGIPYSRGCPCGHYGVEVSKEARKRIREYFGKEKERGK